MSLSKVSFSMIQGEIVNAIDYGLTTTDVVGIINSAALNAAIAAGTTIRIPAGQYKIATTIALGKFTRLLGDGGGVGNSLGTTLIGAAGITVLQAHGCVPPAFTSLSQNEIRDISLIGYGFTGVGLDMYCCDGSVFHNFSATGFNYGIYARTTIGIIGTGLVNLEDNNVGIKIPVFKNAGVANTQNIAANLWTFDYLNIRHNIKAGASLGCASSWTINTLLGESNPVIMYGVQGIQNFTIHNLYQETSLTGPDDRYGNAIPWALYMGIDEDGIVQTLGNSFNIRLDNIYDNSGQANINLNNVSGVKIYQQFGRGTIQLGNTSAFVESNSLSTNVATQTQLVGIGKNVANGVFRKHTANMIANGNFAYENSPLVYAAGVATVFPIVTTQTINSLVTRTLDITLPGGSTSYSIMFRANIPSGADFNNGGINIIGTAQLQTISDDVTNTTINIIDANGSLLASGSTSNSSASWKTVNAAGSLNKWHTTNNFVTIELLFDRATGIGDTHVYLDEVAVMPNSLGSTIVYPSPFDTLAGCLFTGTTVNHAGTYYLDFTIDASYLSETYEVFVTISNNTVDAPRVVKGNGTFRVYSSAVVPFAAFLVPKVFVAP
jgi:hypothetical protein